MTRKHFEAVAEIINSERLTPVINFDGEPDERIEGHNEALENIANDLAHYFATENERFDGHRFIKACGFDGLYTRSIRGY